jgi:plastocyanin
MKKFCLLLGLLVLVGCAQQGITGGSVLGDLNTDDIVGTTMPDFVRSLFGDARINLHIAVGDNIETFGLITENGVITQFTDSALQDPTLKVFTSEEVIVGIAGAKNPLRLFRQALDDDEISYKAVGVGNKIKYSFVSMVIRITSWFSEAPGEDLENQTDIETNVAGSAVAQIVERQQAAAESVENEETVEDSAEADEEVEESAEEVIEEPEEVEPEPAGPQRHIVLMTNEGFDPYELKIKQGDTVEWQVTRVGSWGKGMIIGVRNCRDIKSKVFKPEDTFEWTFDEVENCVLVDGIMTTKDSRIIVE